MTPRELQITHEILHAFSTAQSTFSRYYSAHQYGTVTESLERYPACTLPAHARVDQVIDPHREMRFDFIRHLALEIAT